MGGVDQLPQQPQTDGSGEGVRPPLQHGFGERERNVGGAAQDLQGQRRTAGQPRPIHLQNVPPRGLRHHRTQEPTRGRQVTTQVIKVTFITSFYRGLLL